MDEHWRDAAGPDAESKKERALRRDLQKLFDEVLVNHMPLVRPEQEICDDIASKWGVKL